MTLRKRLSAIKAKRRSWPKKPKLETVTRIFYSLLCEGKLAGQKAILNYLVYTVKIDEIVLEE